MESLYKPVAQIRERDFWPPTRTTQSNPLPGRPGASGLRLPSPPPEALLFSDTSTEESVKSRTLRARGLRRLRAVGGSALVCQSGGIRMYWMAKGGEEFRIHVAKSGGTGSVLVGVLLFLELVRASAFHESQLNRVVSVEMLRGLLVAV